jgi:hypothetical protein
MRMSHIFLDTYIKWQTIKNTHIQSKITEVQTPIMDDVWPNNFDISISWVRICKHGC